MRYAWDLYHNYLNQNNLNKGLKGVYAKYILSKIRLWDIISSNRVDYFIANSHYISHRIRKTYRRDSVVIYPPVNTQYFELQKEKEDYYFTASRLVSNKNIDVIIKAFNEMPSKKLIIAGDGIEAPRLKKLANINIEFVGHVTNEELKTYLKNARAFIFASIEDFGIAPVEAQSCGTPVICLNKGGCRETVIKNITGIYFEQLTPKHIIESIQRFETMDFEAERIRENALRFSNKVFETNMKNFIEAKFFEHQKMIHY
jgi:glycosyltransferase involved in cell wall biosynthesis